MEHNITCTDIFGNLGIREMTLEDLFVVADMERRLFTDPWGIESFKSGLNTPNQHYYVICDEEKILGYCGVMVAYDDVQLLNIAVDVPYRRQGLAKIMMNTIIALAAQSEMYSISLEVRAGNTPAQRLYGSFGFEYIGCRTDYYSNPKEDALLMELILDDDGEE